MASTYIKKTPSSTTNQRTWTVSCWVKRSLLTSRQIIWGVTGDVSGNYYTQLEFNSGDQLEFIQGGTVGDPYQTQMLTSARYRDTNGWYHIVVAADTTQATEANRLKIYVNGEQITSFAISNYPSQNEQFRWHYTGYQHSIGISGFDTARYFNGSISHFHNIDGTQYAASDFGSTDSTTGEWKINTSPSVTYGSFGTFLLKDGNSVTDQSGRGNNWTVGGGTLTKTEDNPSNVFATINALSYAASLNYTLKNGNTSKDVTNTTNAWRSAYGTIGASSGKYYFELKVTGRESGDPGNMFVGIVDSEQMKNESSNERFVKQTRGYGFHAKGYKENNSNNTSYGSSWHTVGDIIGVAMDLDNSKIYFSKNGTWQNSGVPTSGSTGTGAAFTLASGYTYLPAFSQYYGNEQYAMNFGNGYFQSTAVSSAGTNASSNGIFEYDVPTGYTALSTKGLNE